MSRINQSLLEKYSHGGSIGRNAVDDDLLQLARDYKKNIASRYQLYTESDIKRLPDGDLYSSIKLDGLLYFLYKDKRECFLYDAYGQVIVNIALLEQANEVLKHTTQVLLVGELYRQDNPCRSRAYAVNAALQKDAGEAIDHLAFAAFNLLEYEADSWREDVPHTLTKLEELLPATGLCHVLKQHLGDKTQVAGYYSQWVEQQGQQGLVSICAANHFRYKIKPEHLLDVVVIGYTEKNKMLSHIMTALIRIDGSFQVVFTGTVSGKDALQQDLLDQIKPLKVASNYQIADSNHTLYNMIKPSVIIALGFHDLESESSHQALMQAVLHYDVQRGYEAQLPEQFISLLRVNFHRIHNDKQVNTVDLGLMQLSEHVMLDNLQTASQQADMATSTIIHREVYRKRVKGKIAIRKFICWQTHKDTINKDYAAFVFCYVDYSPSRKTPLNRKVRIANSQQNIQAIFDAFIKKEVKKGWELVIP